MPNHFQFHLFLISYLARTKFRVRTVYVQLFTLVYLLCIYIYICISTYVYRCTIMAPCCWQRGFLRCSLEHIRCTDVSDQSWQKWVCLHVGVCVCVCIFVSSHTVLSSRTVQRHCEDKVSMEWTISVSFVCFLKSCLCKDMHAVSSCVMFFFYRHIVLLGLIKDCEQDFEACKPCHVTERHPFVYSECEHKVFSNHKVFF